MPRAAALLETAVERKGHRRRAGGADRAPSKATCRVERVVLKDGRAYPADLVVMAVGIRAEHGAGRKRRPRDRPRHQGRRQARRPAVPGIYAIGECAEHRGTCYGLVEPAYEQARVLARYLSGRPARYEGSLLATQPQGVGRARLLHGRLRGRGRRGDRARGPGAAAYRKLVVRDGSPGRRACCSATPPTRSGIAT